MTRAPERIPSGRIAPLSRLPTFFALRGKRVIVAGGSAAASWKAELLSAAGAQVEVFVPEPDADMLALADAPPDGAVVIQRRNWSANDFDGAAIAVADCPNDQVAAQFAAAARNAGVPVNVIDRPAFCDFSFGAIINRSPLVIGISTEGAAPVFGQAIRAKIEALIPQGFARWAAAALAWRPRLRTHSLSFRSRRTFWERFTVRAMAAPDRTPDEAELDALLAVAPRAGGSVTLVGAGPGDPELLTLRAVRALQSADVILFDDLVSRDVLDFARREARKMLVGKTGFGPSCKQEDINALMVSLARQGKRVVRLKGGDPLIFGRAAEEIEACRAANVAFDVVPGITAAQGAAARLGLPLTERKRVRRLQYVTGHATKNGLLPSDFDWQSLADPLTTTAIYMPTHTLAALVEKAVAEGLDPRTPAVAIARATRPDQSVVAAPVATLPQRLDEAALPGPVLVMIGRSLGEQAAAREGRRRSQRAL